MKSKVHVLSPKTVKCLPPYIHSVLYPGTFSFPHCESLQHRPSRSHPSHPAGRSLPSHLSNLAFTINYESRGRSQPRARRVNVVQMCHFVSTVLLCVFKQAFVVSLMDLCPISVCGFMSFVGVLHEQGAPHLSVIELMRLNLSCHMFSSSSE